MGHGSDAHYREPKIVEGLVGKKVVDVAVGVLHCLCVTENGEVSLLLFLFNTTMMSFSRNSAVKLIGMIKWT